MDVPTGIQLEAEFLDRLNESVRERKAKSVSEIIRAALECFDFEDVAVPRPAHVSMSVRLPIEVRRDLKRIARAKQTSIGQLVRLAVDSYLPHLDQAAAGQLEIEMPSAVPHEPEPSPSAKSRPASTRPAAETARKNSQPPKRAAKRTPKTPRKTTPRTKKARSR